MKLMLSVFLAASLVLGGVMLMGPAESGEVGPGNVVLTAHDPIRINNDTDFVTLGFSGSGTSGDPWVIENLEINGIGASRSCIYVGNTTEYFTINNCTVYNINGTYVGYGYFSNAGILIYNVSNGMILNNTAFHNLGDGVSVWESSNVTIASNNLNNNTGDGIFFTSMNNSLIQSNNITDNLRGVAFTWSENNTVSGNHITNISSKFGIYIGVSLNNTLTNNTMLNCGIHFVEGNFLEHWASQTIDTLNTVNGQIAYYWKNLNGGTVPLGAGQVILANCSGVSVENQAIDHGSYGISMGFCSNVSVANSSFSNSSRGISLYESDYSHISDCSFSNNSLAINVAKSDNSEVTDSTFGGNDDLLRIEGSYNVMDGNSFNDNNGNIFFQTGNYNKVTNNTFSNGTGAISTFLSWYNQITDNDFISNMGTISVGWDGGGHNIYHNNFINNTNPATDESTDSEWDNGYPSGGNYWSDYSGTDNYYGPDQDIWGKDGIGDSNYSITGLNSPADNYPLMQPYTGQPLGPDIAQAPFALTYTPNGTAEPVDVPIIITWNETMNWTSVEEAFECTDGTTNWTSANGTWEHNSTSNVSVFTPAEPFLYETHYVVTVNSSAADIIGNMLDQNRNGTGGEWDDFLQWSFTTDDEAPYIISTSPADNQVDVDPYKPFKIVFSESMNRTSVEAAFSYTDGNMTWNITDGAGYWNALRTELTFTPAEPLATNTSFTATLDGYMATDAGGKGLKFGNHTWEFSTWLEPPAPGVTSTYPPDGSFGVNVNSYINIAFDCEMDAQSVQDAFSYTDGADVWTAADGTADWFSDNTLFSFQPAERLGFDTEYTVTVSSEATSVYGVNLDGNGNGIRDEDDDFVFGFTTTPEPPTVVSHYPLAGQRDLATNLGAIYINFSTPMLITSVSNAVSVSPSTPFTPTFSGAGQHLTLTLGSTLQEATEYRVTVLGTATDMTGIKLDGNGDGWPGDKFTFSFYTEGMDVVEPLRIIDVFPRVNSTIPVDSIYVGITFNAIMNRTSVQNAFSFRNASEEVNGTFSWSSSGKSFRFIPSQALAYNATYTVSVTGTAKDADGRVLGNTTTWHYTTESEAESSSLLDWVLYGVIITLLALCTILYMANRALRMNLKRTRVKLKRLKRQAGIRDEATAEKGGGDVPEEDLPEQDAEDMADEMPVEEE